MTALPFVLAKKEKKLRRLNDSLQPEKKAFVGFLDNRVSCSRVGGVVVVGGVVPRAFREGALMVFPSTPGLGDPERLQRAAERPRTKSRFQPSQRTGLEHGARRKMSFSPRNSIQRVWFFFSHGFALNPPAWMSV